MIEKKVKNDMRADSSLARKLVLVVDDDEVSRIMLSGMLKKFGFTFLCIEDGCYLSFSCSYFLNVKAVFMDMNMPMLDGYKTTKKIRKTCSLNRGLDHLPIIAVSGIEENEKRCIKAGCDLLLRKPLSLSVLRHTLMMFGLYDLEPHRKGAFGGQR